jgi:hypothetical protein
MAYWNGSDSQGGVVNNLPAGPTPYTLNYTFQPQNVGTITRWATIKDGGGNVVCTTNTITVTVQPAPPVSCAMTINGSTNPPPFTVGQTETVQVTSSVPGYNAYWNGSDSGGGTVSNLLAGPTPYTLNYTFGPQNVGTIYRYATIKDGSGNVVCTTNSVTVTVVPTPVSCSLTSDQPSYTVGQTSHWQFTSSPPGLTAYWEGTDSAGGVANDFPAGGTTPLTVNYTFGPNDAKTYTRYAKFKDAGGNVVCTSTPFSVTVSPSTVTTVWSAVTNANVSGGTLTKNVNCGGCANSGGVSTQTLSGNGSLTFNTASGSDELWVGILPAGSGAQPLPFLQSIVLNGGYAEVYQGSSYVTDIGTYAGGTQFTIQVQNGTVNYYNNGSLKFSKALSASYQLQFGATLLSNNSSILNASVTVGP